MELIASKSSILKMKQHYASAFGNQNQFQNQFQSQFQSQENDQNDDDKSDFSSSSCCNIEECAKDLVDHGYSYSGNGY